MKTLRLIAAVAVAALLSATTTVSNAQCGEVLSGTWGACDFTSTYTYVVTADDAACSPGPRARITLNGARGSLCPNTGIRFRLTRNGGGGPSIIMHNNPVSRTINAAVGDVITLEIEGIANPCCREILCVWLGCIDWSLSNN